MPEQLTNEQTRLLSLLADNLPGRLEPWLKNHQHIKPDTIQSLALRGLIELHPMKITRAWVITAQGLAVYQQLEAAHVA